MGKKILVVIVLALAFGSLPASASAADPEVDFTTEPTEGSPLEAAGTGGAASVVSVGGSTVSCTSSHIKFKWTSKKTLHVHILFTGCTSSGFSCNSTGLGSGEITWQWTLAHLKKLWFIPIGIKITPPTGGVFAQFNCTFLVSVKVTGNGVIGQVTKPACGGKSSSSTVSFTQSSAGVQSIQEVEGESGKTHLETSFNGGAAEEAALVTEGTTTLAGGAEGTYTCP